ncbi:30S ribosomal protein S15 [Patescibacteria group bacterium]|nr:30S ribosomal protein S15 [Patescibacteria group bacterium]MBU1256449.1 30S ribosomal protein S15 [Patescibacteria group bacterium]MBU1457320.1 30S ribosomal protein S15 [Patescibacteria group bacterium]
MALDSKVKQKIISKFAAGKKDTGSPRVQIALLSTQISQLTDHLKEHKKDNHSRRGLLKIISKRRRLLNYLNSKNPTDFKGLIKELKINA